MPFSQGIASLSTPCRTNCPAQCRYTQRDSNSRHPRSELGALPLSYACGDPMGSEVTTGFEPVCTILQTAASPLSQVTERMTGIEPATSGMGNRRSTK